MTPNDLAIVQRWIEVDDGGTFNAKYLPIEWRDAHDLYDRYNAAKEKAEPKKEAAALAAPKPRKATRYVTQRTLDATMRGVGEAVRDIVIPLAERVSKLEAKPEVKYLGLWKPDLQCEPGNMVTNGGSMWHANISSKGVRPGDGNAFTLCVKRGRDGRDAK